MTIRPSTSSITPQDLALEDLKKLAHYDPATGVWLALIKTRKQKAGARLDHKHTKEKYRRLTIQGKKYFAHRLAWFYMTGQWPIAQIDHRNRNTLDNRWFNLREATSAGNNRNSRKPKNNTSGYKGVSWDAKTKRWSAHIRANGKSKRLGRFSKIEAAAVAYKKAATLYFGEFACHE